MCILITKEKGVHFPSAQTIRNCVSANPDGFALVYNDGGKLNFYKTLDAKEFMRVYMTLADTLDHLDTAMMIHARIATHGSVRKENCHGWIDTILGTDMAFAHNGILRIPARADMTDSETFLRDWLVPCETMGEFLSAIEENIGASKFAFLDGDGNILRFGQFIDHRGVQYSNRSFDRAGFRSADPRGWRMAI